MSTEAYAQQIERDSTLREAPFEHAFRGVSHAAFLERLSVERSVSEQRKSRLATAHLDVICPPGATPEGVIVTARSWRLQSSVNTTLRVVVNATLDARRLARELERSGLTVQIASAAEFTPLAAAYVICVRAGSSLHPSLAFELENLQEPADIVMWNAQIAGATRATGHFIRHPSMNLPTLLGCFYANDCVAFGYQAFHEVSSDSLRASAEHGDVTPLVIEIALREKVRTTSISRYLSRVPDASHRSVDPSRLPTAVAQRLQQRGWQVHSAANEVVWPRQTRGVSVIIPFRDKPELMIRCLESIAMQTAAAEIECILVDNQSKRQTLDEIDRFAGSHVGVLNVRVVHYDRPFNHSAQTNLGIASAEHDVLLFLNNDVILNDAETIDVMARWAEAPDVGLVGCRFVDSAGHLVHAGIRTRLNAGPYWNSPVEESRDQHFARVIRTTFGASFACAALTRQSFNLVGPLNEREFPNGYNDVEYACRTLKSGLCNVYAGTVAATHSPGSSRRRTDETLQKVLIRERYPEVLVRPVDLQVDDLLEGKAPRSD